MPPRRYKVIVMIGSGGGGHMATGRALRDACQAAKINFDFQTVDVSEILGLTVTVGDGIYNWLMSSGRAKWIPTWHNFGKVLSSMNERSLIEVFRSHLASLDFDMLISCIPFVNNIIAESISSFKPPRPMVTLLSDFENTVDHPWMQDHRQILICGTENAIKQAEALGHPMDRIYGTSGMIVHPSFYSKVFEDRSEERLKLGLNPEWRTVCVLFGGFAPVFLPKVVQILCSVDEPLNLVLMCGKNKDAIEDSLREFLTPPFTATAAADAAKLAEEEKEAAKLEGDKAENGVVNGSGSVPLASSKNHVALVGFTDQVAYYMRLCDALVGKPGPGVVSEALVSGLPVIVELNEEHTPPQEQAVAHWISDHHVGVVIDDFKDLPYAIARERMDECKANVDKIKNNAVFEVPHILSGVMKGTLRRHRRILSATSPQEMLSSPQQAPDGLTAAAAVAAAAAAARERSPSINSGSSTAAVLHMGGIIDEQSSVAGSSADIIQDQADSVVDAVDVVIPRIDSLSVNSPSYSDAILDFPEPLRLDDENVPSYRLLINASGRWGHDVVKFNVTKAADPETFEITLSSGYYVSWLKELQVQHGTQEKARLFTKNEDHGPKSTVFHKEDFPSGVLRLNFNKAGFLGVKSSAYIRYLDVSWCTGKVIHFIWSREKHTSNQRE